VGILSGGAVSIQKRLVLDGCNQPSAVSVKHDKGAAFPDLSIGNLRWGVKKEAALMCAISNQLSAVSQN
jgi:hypothetical protein